MEPIELEYDTMDEVPEAVRGLYTETDGKAILTGVRGMKTQQDVDNVQEALGKERNLRRDYEKQLKPWKDMDPEEVRSKLDRIGELETAAGGKLDDDAINKIVETRLTARTAPLERRIDELQENLGATIQERDAAKGTITDMRMSSAIRDAATRAKITPSALSDVEIIAKSGFEFSEDGKLVTTEKSGVTPGLGLDAYFKEMTKSRPHWWPASEGGGAGGGSGGGMNGAKNPFSAEHWDMTKQGALVREDREQAEQLAKLAGTTIGGRRPQPKS